MHELVQAYEALLTQIKTAITQLNIREQKEQLVKLNTEMTQPDFWNNPQQAAEVSKAQADLSEHIKTWEDLEAAVQEALELARLGDGKLETELRQQLEVLQARYNEHEFELTLSGTYDQNNAIVHIHAGAGGTDAQDWAQILERMYVRWAEAHQYIAAILSESGGEEAGIKNAILSIDGAYAYGKLRAEHGVHRLVRKSPFNADHLRQTSFALVEVLPQINEPKAIAIEPKDLKIDVYRSGGHGGQSVNTTDSAVRITHLPTGITVAIQNERSQLQNRETALTILRARLAKLAQEQHQEEMSKLKGPSLKAEWGQQIRNYVLDPYKLVKDTRTHLQVSDVDKVLSGDIDPFITAYLKTQLGKNRA